MLALAVCGEASAFRVRWTVGIIRRLREEEAGKGTKVAADVKCNDIEEW